MKNHQNGRKKEKILSSHANISDTPFDKRSTRPPEEGVLIFHKHKDTETDRHTDMTESTLRIFLYWCQYLQALRGLMVFGMQDCFYNNICFKYSMVATS